MGEPFGKGHHLSLVDGSAFIFRAYHALPPLTRKSDGLPVGAVSGFCNMLWKMIQDAKGPDAPTHAAVVFDKGSVTFRNEIFDAYKANRDAMPEDLSPQIPLTREATRAFNVACLEQEGFEADDIIASLACKAREAGGRVTIVSSDKDLMQLVGEGVEMLDPMKNVRIDADAVREKFGVGPDRVVDVQALAGDSIDNVPGAPGIGVKTAALLINEFGDLDSLLARAGEIKQPKRRQTLIDHAEQIRVSKRLVELDCRMELGYELESLEVQEPEPEVLLEFLQTMEFRAIVKRVGEALGVAPQAVAHPVAAEPETPAEVPFERESYAWIGDEAELIAWIGEIRALGRVALDARTRGMDGEVPELVGLSMAVGPNRVRYLPLRHLKGEDLFEAGLAEGQIPAEQALELLRPTLEDPAVLKIGHNIKTDVKVLARHGIALGPVDDAMLLSYALHGGLHGHDRDELAERYLGFTCSLLRDLVGSGKGRIGFDRVRIEDASPFSCEGADVVLRLWERLKPELHRARVTTVYETLERPLIPVLARMERAGVMVDRDVLSRMSGAFEQKMAALEAEIHALAGEPFNVGSPSQLGEILFGKMGLPGGKRGKTGAYGTPAQVLEDLATEHELPGRVLDWRQIAKLKNTYTDNLQTAIDPETGRVHTSYMIAGANTGRLASQDPNLQNIPIRTEEGRRIREAFVAAPGKVLVSLDYSQIELRILAHIAGIEALKQAFREGQDIHAATASEMFGVPIEDMTPETRRRAKAINFGVIYGISGFGLARNLRIPRDEAQGFIDRYFERFPGIRDYMSETTAFAMEHGYVQTLFGRKIHTPEINAKGHTAAFARRAAINAPIQGTAADVIRRAMIRMDQATEGLPARMLLSVHDELLFEVDEGAEDALIERARAVMQEAAMPAISLTVPLVAEAGQGATWAAAH